MNRIADVFFVLGIILLFLIFKTTDYYLIFNLLPYIYNENIYFLNIFVKKIDLIAFFLFIGSIGKSAQIGFHTWLPDAMEGPTPVSALLHAATMVTAGVFLIIRASLIFEYSSKILILLIIFGTITALFSSMIAVFQYDIKKIIAYSTCSQLGYMFFSCGLSNYNVAFFHLFNHAFFKSLLFLSAGVLIHSLFDEQDIRKMGNLIYMLNFVYFSILIGSLAILGFPFLSGFYSKDLILELVYSRYIFDSIYIYLMALIAALFTSIYSLKIIFYVFFHKINTNYIIYEYFMKNKVEVWNLMYISLFSLVILSIISGYLFSDMFIGYGSLFWNNSISQFYYNYIFIDVEFMHPLIKNLPIILCFLVMFILYILLSNIYNIKFIYIYYNIYIYIASFFYYGLFFNKIYNKIYNQIYYYSYTVTNKYLDKGLLEIVGPFGVYKLFFYLNKKIIYMVSSLIYIYIFFFLFSLLIFFILLILINFVNISFIINNLFILIFFILTFFCFNKIEKIK
jgi:NADH-ubiquinone oxidoreductase chain 5